MFFIKDLKDLDNGTTRVSIDIKVLKDLKRPLDDGQRGGQTPALRGIETGKSLLPGIIETRVSPTERIEI